MKKFMKSLMFIMAAGLVAFGYYDDYERDMKNESKKQEEQVQPKTKVETRKEFLSKHFNMWTGSHKGLEKIVIDSMNDPDSYEHINTDYWDHKTYLILKMTFTGKNAFGGRVKEVVKAKVDMNGNVLKILK